jgi:hypothetical protein
MASDEPPHRRGRLDGQATSETKRPASAPRAGWHRAVTGGRDCALDLGSRRSLVRPLRSNGANELHAWIGELMAMPPEHDCLARCSRSERTRAKPRASSREPGVRAVAAGALGSYRSRVGSGGASERSRQTGSSCLYDPLSAQSSSRTPTRRRPRALNPSSSHDSLGGTAERSKL